MKKALPLLLLLLLAGPGPVSSATYAFPSSYQPAIGDTVTAADGALYEITGACTFPGSFQTTASQLIAWGVIPCRDFVQADAGTVNFLAQGGIDPNDSLSCLYQEYFYCPATPSTQPQEVPLDWGKAISFLLGGLTGIGFVMAASLRW